MKVGQRYKPYRVFNGIYIPESIVMLHNKTLSYGAKIAFGRLCRYAGKEDVAYPKLETLASEIGCSKRQAGNFIKELRKLGFIEVERLGLGRSNRYYFIWHKIFEIDFLDKKLKRKYISTQSEHNFSSQDEHSYATHSINKESHYKRINKEKVTAEAVHIGDLIQSDLLDTHFNEDVLEIVAHYRKVINSRAYLDEKASENISILLKEHSVKCLKDAIDGFATNEWMIKHHSKNGIAWFFKDEDRVLNWSTWEREGLKIHKVKV